MRLKDRVAIVTGGARGIGRHYCVGLAREGARVVVADLLPAEETVASVREAGGEALAIKVDVTSAESVGAMVAQVGERFSGIDILVNNAALYGDGRSGPFDRISEEEWDRMMAVNVKGVWMCCKAVVPPMKQRGKGKIVNISSNTIWTGMPGFLHYVASKGAVLALTRALARELSGSGINVNAITPGFTMTEASRKVSRQYFEPLRQRFVEMQIIKRNEEAPDLVGTVVFLASDDSDFVTGQAINCDGGAAHH